MKRRSLLFGLTALIISGAVALLATLNQSTERRYAPRKQAFNAEIKGAIQWLSAIRDNRITGGINVEDVLNARKEIAALAQQNKAIGIDWDELGPNNVGGRVRAILVDKDNSSLLFAGGVSGGLWKSITGGTSWEPVLGFTDVNVNCIAQNPLNGHIFVGTGESFANAGYVGGTPGFLGSGLYYSSDGGVTWSIFKNAQPTTGNNMNSDWAFVNRIAFDPQTGRIYVATNKGLRYCDEGSTTWVNPVYLTNGVSLNTGNATCVVTASDRSVAVAIGNKVWISDGGTGNGEPHTFADRTPATGFGRSEYAFAPSNPNYLYCLAAATNGSLKGVYRSTDRGVTWSLIGPGGAPAFNLFGDNRQGDYDNVIAVFPNNPDRILVGGINLWEWYLGSNFTQKTAGFEVHVDHHAIVFDPKNPNVYYIGTDGGVAKTSDAGQSYQHINKNLNITQFYAVAVSGTGAVMGGTQDNSSPYISRTTIDPRNAEVLYGGDGGWSCFSLINPDLFFGTMQYGGVWRSPDRGVTFQEATADEFVSAEMLALGSPGTSASFAAFVTPMLLWESFNDYYSPDYALYINLDTLTYYAGDVITVRSNNNRVPFTYTLTSSDAPLAPGDSLMVQDIISARYYLALSNGVWMTRQAHDFSKTPKWYRISNVANIHTMSYSKCGNYLYLGTINGQVYRLSNLMAAVDSMSSTITSPYCAIEQKLIKTFTGQAVTSIGVDPNNPARIVVTLGNYGSTTYVHYSANALSETPTFEAKQGAGTNPNKLPAMPVYSAMFEMSNPNMVILGTEYGIFATTDITKPATTITWSEENNNISRVPVFMIRQQIFQYPGVTNYGAIYVGTHGRGFFENRQYLSINQNQNTTPNAPATLNIYPNPVVESANISYSIPATSDVQIRIYDLSGKIVRTVNYASQRAGDHKTSINCIGLKNGTYIMQLIAGKENRSAKFIISR